MKLKVDNIKTDASRTKDTDKNFNIAVNTYELILIAIGLETAIKKFDQLSYYSSSRLNKEQMIKIRTLKDQIDYHLTNKKEKLA